MRQKISTLQLKEYEISTPTIDEAFIVDWYYRQYGIDISVLSEEIKVLLMHYYQHGASKTMMNLIFQIANQQSGS